MLTRLGAGGLVLGLVLFLLGCAIVDERVVARWAGFHQRTPELDERGRPTIPPVPPVIFVPGSKGSVLKRVDRAAGPCGGKELRGAPGWSGSPTWTTS